MRETFEAFVHHGDARRFHALTCERDEIMAHAKELLEESGADAIVVHHLGEHLFTLEK